MKAMILNIGDEILIGQVVNTNASYIAKQLNLCGIEVHKIEVVKDDETSILFALEEGQNYDIVVITGGLGPTKDDITKHTLAKFVNDTLIENDIVLKDIQKLLSLRNRQMNELNKKQALVLSQCKIIRNNVGTAPGMIIKKNNTIYVSLPGVPYEMKPMMKEFIQYLSKNFTLPSILHKTLLVFGIPESELAIKIEHWETQLSSEGIKLAYLPNRNFIRLRMSSYHSDEYKVDRMNFYAESLKKILGKHFIGEENFDESDEHPLAKALINILREKRMNISFAESCTGGNVASLITKVAGASDVFKGSVVCYSNEVKQEILKVSTHTLQTYGAVSEECVREMVIGVKELMKTDVALSISGIAGPTGGTPEKPIGTVWMGLSWQNTMVTKLFQFEPQSREYVIESATFHALAWILKKLIEME